MVDTREIDHTRTSDPLPRTRGNALPYTGGEALPRTRGVPLQRRGHDPRPRPRQATAWLLALLLLLLPVAAPAGSGAAIQTVAGRVAATEAVTGRATAVEAVADRRAVTEAAGRAAGVEAVADRRATTEAVAGRVAERHDGRPTLLTLQAALARALEHNPDLLAAREELTVARGRLIRARYPTPFNPRIEAGAAERDFDGGGGATQYSGALSLEIEIAGQRGKRIEEAKRNLERVEALVRDVERRLRSRVQTAFYRTLYLTRRRELFREIESLNERLRNAARKRYESGEVAKLEANLAVVRYVQSRRDALAAESDYTNAVRELERLIGEPPTGTTRVSGELPVMLAAPPLPDLLRAALSARPDLQARHAEVARIEAERELMRRQIVPNPTLRATYDEEREAAGLRDRIFGAGVVIALPLFDRRQGELAALAGRRTQAGYELAAAELDVKAEVRQAYRRYTTALETARLFEEDALARIRENFRFIETAYRAGKIDLLQLVVVENDLVAAQLSYLDSLWETWRAHAALEQAVGQPLEQGADQ